ncbi:1-phosphofructokinase [Paenibacillus sp. CAA11]|uniref:1-phosphofructokinase n=1 Tax=Paenibacillus sp. CAA11 TaxID=1532905 RepID=UPI000D39C907|nr:1-phosphofructokinase [Paenibacillus sp. CAA11]AWB44196.1 1-phosphofructokinase [Paenibacillus sp. CAA11]
MKHSVLTITLNPALDKTVNLDQFEVGGLNRVSELRIDPGGKGINVAKVLRQFGESVITTGFVGGYTGEQLLTFLDSLQIRHEFIEVSGETRTNLKIVDNTKKITTEINERGPEILSGEAEVFKHQIGSLLDETAVLVLGGSVSPGISQDIYQALIEAAKLKEVKTILDADGEALKHGLKAKPYAIKPNIHELEQLLGKKLDTEEEIISAGNEFIRQGVSWVIVSMGGEGSLFISQDEVVRAHPFPITPKSTVGAGDSMVAAISACLLHGRSLEETARWATAAGTVTASMPGTEVCSLEEVETHLDQVQTFKRVNTNH